MKQQLLPRGLSLPFLRSTASKRTERRPNKLSMQLYPEVAQGQEKLSLEQVMVTWPVVLTAAEVFTLLFGIIFAVFLTLFPFPFLSFNLFPLPFPQIPLYFLG